MVRMFVRFGFWAALVTVALPGLKHADVFKNGVNSQTLSLAAQLAYNDLVSFCPRNPTVCRTGQSIAADTLKTAKTAALAAYQGIRTQYDEPDRDTVTASIRK